MLILHESHMDIDGRVRVFITDDFGNIITLADIPENEIETMLKIETAWKEFYQTAFGELPDNWIKRDKSLLPLFGDDMPCLWCKYFIPKEKTEEGYDKCLKSDFITWDGGDKQKSDCVDNFSLKTIKGENHV